MFLSLSTDLFPGVSFPWTNVFRGQLCSSGTLLSLFPPQSVLLDAYPGNMQHILLYRATKIPLLLTALILNSFCSNYCIKVVPHHHLVFVLSSEPQQWCLFTILSLRQYEQVLSNKADQRYAV